MSTELGVFCTWKQFFSIRKKIQIYLRVQHTNGKTCHSLIHSHRCLNSFKRMFPEKAVLQLETLSILTRCFLTSSFQSSWTTCTIASLTSPRCLSWGEDGIPTRTRRLTLDAPIVPEMTFELASRGSNITRKYCLSEITRRTLPSYLSFVNHPTVFLCFLES